MCLVGDSMATYQLLDVFLSNIHYVSRDNFLEPAALAVTGFLGDSETMFRNYVRNIATDGEDGMIRKDSKYWHCRKK